MLRAIILSINTHKRIFNFNFVYDITYRAYLNVYFAHHFAIFFGKFIFECLVGLTLLSERVILIVVF